MSLRVLIAVTHLLGVGHVTRAAAIARAFARAGHETTLVSGGVPAPLISTEGVRFVQLPPARAMGTAFTTLLDEDGRPIDDERLRARRELLLAAFAEACPDVIVTELFPFGRRVLAGEFLALLEAAEERRPRPLVAASVRDILVAPSKPQRVEETHRRLTEHYDAVLAHGDPALVPLDQSWPLTGDARRLVRYTGYVDDCGSVDGDTEGRGEIVVSGGGSAASLPLYRAALDAAVLVGDRRWRILVGRGVADAAFAEIREAAPRNVLVERARPDFRALLRGAALSVSQAGYNTVVDLLRSGVRSILVPFEGGHETEQRLRAESLVGRGLADLLTEGELSGENLAPLVWAALANPRPPVASIDLGGAERTVAIVEELAQAQSDGAFPVGSRLGGGQLRTGELDWRPLDEALRRASDGGRAVAFWWRDDDAVAHTPALDRLLALSERLKAPIALAVVPAKVEPSLAERVDGAGTATMLVHGLAHANHAPPGAKKAEFGPHRPIERLRPDAAEALEQARRKLGTRVLPVFVPPWNRMAPDLLGALPGLGYGGLSIFGQRKEREPAPGLVQANTHVDPIDWRGSRSLADSESLIAGLADLVDARTDGRADPEPVGLLTHHLIHDEGVWAFCEALLERLAAHAGVRRPFVADVFSCQGAIKP